MINLALDINLARGLPCLMLHKESSFMVKGILNLECAVLPLANKSAAIPLEATFKTITPLDLIEHDIVDHKNVFPQPPWPYKKKSPPILPLTAPIIWSYANFCSLVSLSKYPLSSFARALTSKEEIYKYV